MAAVAKMAPEFASETELFNQYENLVRRLAFKMAKTLPDSVCLDDLCQAGFMGLIEAYRRFDGTSGASFATYATIRINGAMLDELRRNAFGSRQVRREARRAAEAIGFLSRREGRVPRSVEIAAELGMETNEYHRLVANSANQQLVSLDTPSAESDSSLGDCLPGDEVAPEVRAQDQEMTSLLHEAIAELPEREREAILGGYQSGLTLKEIGSTIGVSESRVCQLQASGLRRLRAKIVPLVAA